MKIVAQVLAFIIFSCAYCEDVIVFPSKEEFNTIMDMTKGYIAENTPWKKIEKFDLSICGWTPYENINEFISNWETESKKSLLNHDKNLPFLHIESRVFDTDIIIVSVSHGTELAGGSFDLYFRRIANRWILKNAFGGGVR